jgi:hypothetical protein
MPKGTRKPTTVTVDPDRTPLPGRTIRRGDGRIFRAGTSITPSQARVTVGDRALRDMEAEADRTGKPQKASNFLASGRQNGDRIEGGWVAGSRYIGGTPKKSKKKPK